MRAGLALALALLAATAQAAEPPKPGQRFQLAPTDLPRPGATASVANSSQIIHRTAEMKPQVPAGFTVTLFAQGLRHARWLAVAPNGDVFLAEPGAGRITVLRDGDGDGVAEVRETFAEGFERPHGLAFHNDALYVADTEAVWRLDWRPGRTRNAEKPKRITPPGALGEGYGHWTRNLAFHPDGTRFFVAVGSQANIAEEEAPRATVMEFKIDGSGGRVFASGLRNAVGIAFRPGSADLYVVVNERDGLGDGLVPDYFTRLVEGGFYGWPYSYIGANPQPNFANRRPDRVASALVPDLLFRSHSAPLGLAFNSSESFPPEMKGDAFVALHGSWNSSQPEGYMVVRVPMKDGKPLGHYEAFATGFLLGSQGGRPQVWGRPVGLAFDSQGGLLIADDAAQVIWRVSASRAGRP
ncbi:MAG: PQQ-dependent sugar dehydrogenase [Rhodospirillales bacterium]|nr:PQQ-dependent sugar dehydrogenase [Rhodospirillales bacterium]